MIRPLEGDGSLVGRYGGASRCSDLLLSGGLLLAADQQKEYM